MMKRNAEWVGARWQAARQTMHQRCLASSPAKTRFAARPAVQLPSSAGTAVQLPSSAGPQDRLSSYPAVQLPSSAAPATQVSGYPPDRSCSTTITNLSGASRLRMTCTWWQEPANGQLAPACMLRTSPQAASGLQAAQNGHKSRTLTSSACTASIPCSLRSITLLLSWQQPRTSAAFRRCRTSR